MCIKNVPALVASVAHTEMLQMMWQEGWVSLQDALCQAAVC